MYVGTGDHTAAGDRAILHTRTCVHYAARMHTLCNNYYNVVDRDCTEEPVCSVIVRALMACTWRRVYLHKDLRHLRYGLSNGFHISPPFAKHKTNGDNRRRVLFERKFSFPSANVAQDRLWN